MARQERPPLFDEVEFAVLGAGYGGLTAAARLREQGVAAKDIRIFDKSGDVGGTWFVVRILPRHSLAPPVAPSCVCSSIPPLPSFLPPFSLPPPPLLRLSLRPSVPSPGRYWNRYPGAMCDVESYVYMPLCDELGYVPTEKCVGQMHRGDRPPSPAPTD